MTVTISQQHNEDRLAGTKANLERGVGAPLIRIYDGTRPANGAAITGQTLLAEFELPRPVGTVANNKLTIGTIPDALIVAGGVATWARILGGDGAFSMDCDVSDPLGNGEVKIAQVELLLGGVARMVLAEFS